MFLGDWQRIEKLAMQPRRGATTFSEAVDGLDELVELKVDRALVCQMGPEVPKV